MGEVECEKMFVFTGNRYDFCYMIYTFLKKDICIGQVKIFFQQRLKVGVFQTHMYKVHMSSDHSM